MKVAIGADHAGFDLKEMLADHLQSRGVETEDVGAHEQVPTDDFPDYAKPVAEAVASGTVDRGILVCATGIGMSMAANKVRGVRAVLCTSEVMARMSREHNDANVLALGSRLIEPECARSIVDTWLDTEFTGEPRHIRRIRKLESQEE